MINQVKVILTLIGVAICTIFGISYGRNSEQNKQLKKDLNGIKNAKKIKNNSDNLSRNDIIDKL